MAEVAQVEQPKDFSDDVSRWDAELKTYERAFKKWSIDAKRISERYALEDERRRGDYIDNRSSADNAEFNILWSNVQTTLPALFAREPVPVVERRHRDPDPVGRIASQILERALIAEMEKDNFIGVFERVTIDTLLTARGVPWVRYEADIRKDEQGEDVVVSERAPTDYVYWKDFAHSPRRSWAEVMRDGWVARRVMLTRRQGLTRFNEKFRDVPLKHMPSGMSESDFDDKVRPLMGMAEVWEIWDCESRNVLWICREHKSEALDKRPDPLQLEGFFPCPQPAYGTLGNANLVPVPDYLQYEQLADELDDVTRRISILVEALRVAGVYDASMEGIGRLLTETDQENVLIPVSNMAALLGRGSQGSTLSNVIQWLPLAPIADALVSLYDARERTKQTLYEVSGIADIIRGQVDPREKLGQSELKGRFATQRLDKRRSKVEGAARDTLRIKAEIICEQFSPQHLRELSGFDQLPEVAKMRENPESAMMVDHIYQKAIELLRNDKLRGFRIDVETDSTAALDQGEEQERRIEFLTAVGSFFENALPVADAVPQLAPLVGDMMLFAVRGFRTGRTLEAAFEDAVERMRQAAEQPPPEQQPDPAAEAEAAKAQTQTQMLQQKSQVDQQKGQMTLAATRAKAEADIAKAQSDMMLTQQKLQATIAEQEAELAATREKLELERRGKLIEIAAKKESATNGAS